MTTARDQDDFNTEIMGLAQSRKIVGRDLEMRIEQRPSISVAMRRTELGFGLRLSGFGKTGLRASVSGMRPSKSALVTLLL